MRVHTPNILVRDHRLVVFTGAVLAIFMASVESTIVATAMPTIVADLGGLKFFAWTFGVFFLGQAITIPVYGRLSDVYGRKRMLYIAIAIFLVASVACGFARSMAMLISFRALQGLGAGGIQPVATTIIGDVFTPVERAKYQGYLSSVWGISAVVGPLLGALLLRFTWSAIFWINVPVGILCVLAFAMFYNESRPGHPSSIDLGSLVRTLLPLHLLRDRVIALADSGTFLIGAAVMGVSAFLPTYIQGVMGEPALVAGIAVAAQSVFWTFGSIIGGRVMLRTSYRVAATAGACALLFGAFMLFTMIPARGTWWADVAAAAMGLGFGMTNIAFLIATQNAVGREDRGAATASILFMRNAGQAVGTAVLGAAFNLGLAAYSDPEHGNPSRYVQTLEAGVHNVYFVTGLLALGLLLIALRLPRGLSPTASASRSAVAPVAVGERPD